MSEHLHFRYPIYQAITALILIGWGVNAFGLVITAASVVQALAMLIMGVVIMRMLNGTVTLSVFWLGRIGNVQAVLHTFSSLAHYPVTIYGDSARRVLTYFLPYGVVGTFPTMLLLGWRAPAWFWLSLVGVMVAWTGVFLGVWRRALRRYEAYGG